MRAVVFVPVGTSAVKLALLRGLGFAELRVRHHGETARIEVALAELPRLVADGIRERVVEGFRALGFRWVAVDLEGLRSGNLNSQQRRGPAGRAMTLGLIAHKSGTAGPGVGTT